MNSLEMFFSSVLVEEFKRPIKQLMNRGIPRNIERFLQLLLSTLLFYAEEDVDAGIA
jgi:hypothetical protein